MSQSQLLEFQTKNNANIGLLSVYGRLMTFSSSSNLTYNLLGYNLSENSLMNEYGNELLKEVELHEFDDTNRTINRYTLKKSFFKIYYNETMDKYYIACASIKDSEIKLPCGIYVGMERDDFFSKLFNESRKYDFSLIDTVLNGSEDGGISQCFLFNSDTLSEIVVNSAMDWISCELN